VSIRFAIYDPDLALVHERTALAHARFHRVAGHLRHTFASTKDLHAINRVNLESLQLAKNLAAASRLRSAKLRGGQRPTVRIASA